MTENLSGKLVIISGPSGVGKSTIARRICEMFKNAHLSISATTRAKSNKEIDGEDYYFISKEQFEERIEKELFLEHAEVFGNMYGTPKDKVDQALEQGQIVILEIDVQGGRQVKEIYPDAIMIFIVPPTPKDLANRMNNRGRGEDEKAAKERLETASQEIAAAWRYYDNMVINDDLEQAVNEVAQIIGNTDGEQ